jgi:hypothetical protein
MGLSNYAGAVKAGIVAAAGGLALIFASPARAADAPIDFSSQIQPILKNSCVKCHSLDNPRKTASGGLRLDDKDAALKGGKVGSDIVPGDSTKSLMYKLLLGPTTVNGKHIDAMPKASRGQQPKPLTKDQIDLIKNWIDQGAKWSS